MMRAVDIKRSPCFYGESLENEDLTVLLRFNNCYYILSGLHPKEQQGGNGGVQADFRVATTPESENIDMEVGPIVKGPSNEALVVEVGDSYTLSWDSAGGTASETFEVMQIGIAKVKGL